MHLGYARVSTTDQHLHLQLDALQGAGCRRVFQEKASGAKAGRARPELARLLEQLRETDTVVVWKLDRLARSTRDLLEIMAAIQAVGAGFRSLSEPWADTTSHAGKLMMTIFAGIAEFERALIRERTSVGRTAAKERGVRFGRPPKFNAEQQRLALRLISLRVWRVMTPISAAEGVLPLAFSKAAMPASTSARRLEKRCRTSRDTPWISKPSTMPLSLRFCSME